MFRISHPGIVDRSLNVADRELLDWLIEKALNKVFPPFHASGEDPSAPRSTGTASRCVITELMDHRQRER